jgi:signal transduction histidine kinase
MRERAEALGGSFEIEPQSTGGTVATVRMPENQEREKAT